MKHRTIRNQPFCTLHTFCTFTLAKVQYILIQMLKSSKKIVSFNIFYKKTDIKPAVLDRGNEIILANWPKSKYVICKDNHEYPIKIPRHPYVLLKRSILCNCDIHAEEHSLLESIATCPDKQSDMTIYYTVNTAFMPYLDNLQGRTGVT